MELFVLGSDIIKNGSLFDSKKMISAIFFYILLPK